ncbi:PREDICTED: gasdermin-C-like [Condylura cristata]|uniref:gasdermin-C-like n=1 Tax=Condylura cristata TaxID=143302 RepID=UPI0006431A83|nr:PREDICTED: gasdermin-C-like [Condylura cristata]
MIGPLTFSDTVLSGLKIGVTVDAVVDTNVAVEATGLQESTLQYQFVDIPRPKLEELRERKLLDPEPSYLQQYRRSQKNLYVVTKVVELLNSPVLTDTRSVGVFGGLSLPWNPAAKVKAEGRGQVLRKRTQALKKGMVMAYQKKQLVFETNGWRFHDIPNEKQKSFPDKVKYSTRTSEMQYSPEDPVSMSSFTCLEREIFMTMNNVTWLSRNVPGVMFGNIQALLGDQQALQDLMDTLEQGETLCHLTGPGATILSELTRIPGYPQVAPVNLIMYLLEAILVLSDTQRDLLAWSMERRILFYQWHLVRSILEPNFTCSENTPFRLDPQLLAPLQGEGVAITYGLLQECGLSMEPDDPRSTWDLDAKEPLSALFATLTILHRLTAA